MHAGPPFQAVGSRDPQPTQKPRNPLDSPLTPGVTETRMETVQASRTIPLRPQWAWHYLCDVLRWDVFLPFVSEVRRLEGERFELGLSDGRSAQMKLVLREPTERLEWVTTDPCFVGGAIIVERLGFRTGVTIQLDLDQQPTDPLGAVQAELEAGLDRLVLHLSDREPIERGPEPVRVVTGLPSLKVDEGSRLPRIR
jgi:Polyketide cyclase / dehydrase and lipid transport